MPTPKETSAIRSIFDAATMLSNDYAVSGGAENRRDQIGKFLASVVEAAADLADAYDSNLIDTARAERERSRMSEIATAISKLCDEVNDLRNKNAALEVESALLVEERDRLRESTPAPQTHVAGNRWRVFEDTTPGYWGIELEAAGNDDDAIMYSQKIHRDTVARIVEAHNAALLPSPEPNLTMLLQSKAEGIRTEYQLAHGRPCDCSTPDSALHYGRAQGLEIAADVIGAEPPPQPNGRGPDGLNENAFDAARKAYHQTHISDYGPLRAAIAAYVSELEEAFDAERDSLTREIEGYRAEIRAKGELDYKLVPLVPTREMIDAWRIDQAQGRSLELSYAAMIDASPSPVSTEATR